MVKFRVLRAELGYKAGQVIVINPRNLAIWKAREWAERVTDEPETATVDAPEKAVRKTGKPRQLKRRKKAADA